MPCIVHHLYESQGGDVKEKYKKSQYVADYIHCDSFKGQMQVSPDIYGGYMYIPEKLQSANTATNILGLSLRYFPHYSANTKSTNNEGHLYMNAGTSLLFYQVFTS